MPTQPTKAHLATMQVQLSNLKALYADMTGEADAKMETLMGSSAIGNDVVNYNNGDGLQDGYNTLDDRYQSALQWIGYAHRDLVSGVNTMISLLEHTITGHSTADTNSADGARTTGTTATAPGASGSNSSTPSAGSQRAI